MAEEFDAVLTALIENFGGTAVTVQAAPTGTSNTKSIAATACLRKNLRRAIESGEDVDTCTFLIPASEFASGFSSSNPVTPVARMTVSVSGENLWVVSAVEPVSSNGYALRCVGS